MLDFFTELPLLQGGGAQSQMVTMMLTFGLIILIFYFLVIRPQKKKKDETQRMLSDLKKGDKVATVGGIRGVVTAVKEQTVTLKVDNSTKLELNKSAVSNILERKGSSTESQ